MKKYNSIINAGKQFFFFAALFLSSLSLTAQGGTQAPTAPNSAILGVDEAPATVFNILAREDQLRITLKADFTTLIANKQSNDYQEASMNYMQGEEMQQLDIKLKVRGKSRRRSCDFPPLKIKFKKADLETSGFITKHKSLKLVTHCLEEDQGEQNLIKEYLAYQLYNQLTDQSFRVKLAEITYEDINGVEAPMVRYGFLIENTNEMAERLGGTDCEDCFNTQLKDMGDRYAKLFTLFQYMIGNTDWNPVMMHNVKIVQLADGKPLIVPYDFDSSGFVNAPYARPNPDYPQINVRHRIYMGDPIQNVKEIGAIARYMKLKEKDLKQTVKDSKLLSRANRRDVLNYMNSFFEVIKNEALLEGEFVKEIR